MNVQDERVAAFHRLHSSGCFVMPNPWDVGSARALERFGFKALATTSAGLAWTLGHPDNHSTLKQTLEHLRVVSMPWPYLSTRISRAASRSIRSRST